MKRWSRARRSIIPYGRRSGRSAVTDRWTSRRGTEPRLWLRTQRCARSGRRDVWQCGECSPACLGPTLECPCRPCHHSRRLAANRQQHYRNAWTRDSAAQGGAGGPRQSEFADIEFRSFGDMIKDSSQPIQPTRDARLGAGAHRNPRLVPLGEGPVELF